MEKNAPLLGGIAPLEPTQARRRRVFLLKGLAIAAILFLWWGSYYSAPKIFEFSESETVNHAMTNEGFGFDDFGTVS
jgi:hypothetical protein